MPAKDLCSGHCIISKDLPKFSMYCGGNVTEFNTKQMAYRCAMFRTCFHFHDEVHKHLLTCPPPTLHWGMVQPCHCKWEWRKDQGQTLSVLAHWSIACTVVPPYTSLKFVWRVWEKAQKPSARKPVS
jgi:hypothetical protein